MNTRILIAPAGWEDRYYDGVVCDMDEFKPFRLIIPYSLQYRDRTAPIREKLRCIASTYDVAYEEYEHDYGDSAKLYWSLYNAHFKNIDETSAVRFNATTSPRDVIWYSLHFLSFDRALTEFSYFRPKIYPDSYLSRDAKAPRLIIKRSGIAYPDRPTCILALAGYDNERLRQLERRYEPKTMLFGIQTGEQLDNKNRKISDDRLQREGRRSFEFDGYDVSLQAVEYLIQQLSELTEPHNIIAASLGPKPSALTLFRLTQKMPEVGLAYIPAADYSSRYSEGTDFSSHTLSILTW
jgi:hypothetical protein